MYTYTTTTTFAVVAALWACSCEASLVKMGLNKDKMPVDIDQVLPTYERTRKLQFSELRRLEGDMDVEEIEDSHSETVEEFVEIQESDGTTIVLSGPFDTDDGGFFNVDGDTVDIDGRTHQNETTVQEDAPVTLPEVEESEDTVSTNILTGPKGGPADHSPGIEPTEISFMILMEDFRYSNGVDSIDDITIGTKFGFTGKIATQAEELGVASGSCTVTSNIKKELSYCDIYHKIDTDNYGGFGSVMVAGTADEVGGRLLVTGTGGSLQSTSQGYALIQFDPAGNPVLYVLLKLF